MKVQNRNVPCQEALLRWRQKFGGSTTCQRPKRGRTGKQKPPKRNPVAGQKGPFHDDMVRK